MEMRHFKKFYLAPILAFVFAALVFSACKKEEKIITLRIEGHITDPNLGSSLGGVRVAISANEVSSGIWNNAFSEIAHCTTESDGLFSFAFEQINAGEFRVDFEKPGYFEQQNIINPDAFSPENPHYDDYEMYSEAWFKIDIVNVNPFDAGDYILYKQLRGTGNCSSCCTATQHQLFGENIDTTFTCLLYGDQWVTYDYIVFKDNQANSFSDSVFAVRNDTTSVVLQY